MWGRAPAAAWFFLAAGIAHAAPAAVDVSARVDRAAVTVGDPVRYEITVTYPAGARVELPAVRGNTGSLEVTDYAVRADTAPDGRAVVTHALMLAAYDVGEDTLPPQRIEVRAAGDTAALVLYTQPTYVAVKPTVPAGARDIADIHDAERLPGAVPWALPLLLAAAAGLWFWMRRRARRPRKTPPPPPRVVSAEEAALARLRALEESAAGGARPFAFTLSEILREYLAARFGIDALEATTAELLERAAPLPLTGAQHGWIRSVSGELDTVKFADGALTAADRDRLLGEARAFVHATPAAIPPADTIPIPNGERTP